MVTSEQAEKLQIDYHFFECNPHLSIVQLTNGVVSFAGSNSEELLCLLNGKHLHDVLSVDLDAQEAKVGVFRERFRCETTDLMQSLYLERDPVLVEGTDEQATRRVTGNIEVYQLIGWNPDLDQLN